MLIVDEWELVHHSLIEPNITTSPGSTQALVPEQNPHGVTNISRSVALRHYSESRGDALQR